jgi:hypothetical protein
MTQHICGHGVYPMEDFFGHGVCEDLRMPQPPFFFMGSLWALSGKTL